MIRESSTPEKRLQRTLVILSQVYVPDPAAVGQHISDVAEAMAAQGWRVVVYTSSRGYDDPSIRYPRRENRGGVEVFRLALSSFGKRSLMTRLTAQISFTIQATVLLLFTKRIDVILTSTSPPFAGFFGAVLGFIRIRPLVWWVMDLNPDQLVLSGAIRESSLPARVFDFLNRFTLKRCRHVIVLDKFMSDRLQRKATLVEKLTIIPPWPHDHLIRAVPPESNSFRQRYFPQACRVVMYSGNHGVSTPVEPLVKAAEILRDEPRLQFAFVGGGVLKAAIEAQLSNARLENALSLPYQPIQDISYSLSAADIHVVSISDAAVGTSHSCKIYNAMLLGKPVIAIAPAESHVAWIVRTAEAGWVVSPGDVDGLVTILRKVASLDGAELKSLGIRGKRYIETHFQRERLLADFCALLSDRGAAPAEP